MLKKVIAGAALIAMAGTAAAATGAETFASVSGGEQEFGSSAVYGTFSPTGAGLSFTDTITFGGLTPSQLYEVVLDFSGYNLGTGVWATLQGSGSANSVAITAATQRITFGSLEAFDNASGGGSFVLTIGAPNALANSRYNGGLAVTPVPEPTAAAMLIAGFAVMGFIAMRRRRQD